MKLGTETNSVNNWMMSGTKGQPEPAEGMGITLLHWTDRTAATITRVERFKSGPRAGQVRAFWFKEDKAIRTDKNGMSESQEYTFEPDADAKEKQARQKKNGAWHEVNSSRIALGYRSAYHDYSF
jgi:hypothetical protein